MNDQGKKMIAPIVITILFLIYLVIPLYIRLLQNVNWNILTVICGVLAAAFIIDCTAYQIVDKRKDTSQNSKE